MKQIAIIGGGYTGLVAAYRLSKLGYKVKIFEKGDSLGGLTSDFQIVGHNVEKAYHALFKTDQDMIDLANEIGVGDKLKYYDSSIAIYHDKKLYPFTTPRDLLNFKPLSFINRIRAGLVVLYLRRIKNFEKFKHITAYEWMRKWAGNQVTEIIWLPLLKGKFDKYYDKISMSWLWARISIRARSR
jgi:protoporphyrinogen oxidase